MNSPRRMLVIYLKLLKDIRFSPFCGENHYRLMAMNEILGLSSDEEESLKRVLGQGMTEKDTTAALVALGGQEDNDHVSVNELLRSSK